MRKIQELGTILSVEIPETLNDWNEGYKSERARLTFSYMANNPDISEGEDEAARMLLTQLTNGQRYSLIIDLSNVNTGNKDATTEEKRAWMESQTKGKKVLFTTFVESVTHLLEGTDYDGTTVVKKGAREFQTLSDSFLGENDDEKGAFDRLRTRLLRMLEDGTIETLNKKKVIVISTSLRHGSNSDMLAEKFVEGAKASGNDVEKISLAGKDIQFCKGCLACQKLGRCVIKDDVNDIMSKVLKADVVVWATPIYYYEMSGQMKTLIDRMNAMYEQDYQFRDVYLLTTAAEDEAETPKRAEMGLTGWIDCYPKSRLAGTLFCGGVNDAREIEGNPKLQEAYELGLRIF